MAGPFKHASWDTKKCKFFFMEVTTYYWAQITSRNIMYFPNFTDSPLHGHLFIVCVQGHGGLILHKRYVCSMQLHRNPWASCQIRKIAGCTCAGNVLLPPRVIDPDMHHGTCITLGSLTSGFFWSRWRERFSRHSQGMRNPQLYVFDKRPMAKLYYTFHPCAQDRYVKYTNT